MPSKKITYSIQIIVILSIFFFVLFNLIFKLIIDLRSESNRKKAEQIEKEKIKHEFIVDIDNQYNQLIKLFQAKEYDQAIAIVKVFNKYGKSDYKNLPEIKKEIRLLSLKKKLEFIPKTKLKEFVGLSKDVDIEQDDSTEVFIRTPRYGQYFYTSDFPIILEGVALSTAGDFSDTIEWASNIDGNLGKGGKKAVTLSIGEHEITAIATNGIKKGSMTIKVFIENKPDFSKKYNKN
ncbi:MAG: hypothetical protein ABFR31_11565 [Thermodesulfobacteriota bacterium]